MGNTMKNSITENSFPGFAWRGRWVGAVGSERFPGYPICGKICEDFGTKNSYSRTKGAVFRGSRGISGGLSGALEFPLHYGRWIF